MTLFHKGLDEVQHPDSVLVCISLVCISSRSFLAELVFESFSESSTMAFYSAASYYHLPIKNFMCNVYNACSAKQAWQRKKFCTWISKCSQQCLLSVSAPGLGDRGRVVGAGFLTSVTSPERTPERTAFSGMLISCTRSFPAVVCKKR